MQAIDHIEIRYRRADTVGDWTYITLPAGETSWQITDIERGLSYQIEARAVGTNGAASIWVQQTHTVADATQAPAAPTSLAALAVADGVHLSWLASGAQRADVEYEVQRTNDVSGSPNSAGWTSIANIKATAYTDGVTDGVVRWYRVRAVDFQGLASAFSNNVNRNNKSVADGADVTAQQAIAYTGASNNLVPNGDFLLGNTQGWLHLASTVAPQFDATNHGILIPASDGGGIFSPTFAVQPGNKYRVTLTAKLAASGTQQIVHRLCYASSYAANINGSYTDFFWGNPGLTTSSWQTYTYEWTCPAGVYFASVALYSLDPAVPCYSHVVVQDYSGVSQWGADVTGSNTSANTNNVGSTPASTVAAVIPNGTKLYINSGSRAYSIVSV